MGQNCFLTFEIMGGLIMAVKRKSAYYAALEEAQNYKQNTYSSELPTEEKANVIEASEEPKEVKKIPQRREFHQFSAYLTFEQQTKLDDLAYRYNKKHNTRIDRQDILRYMIDS